MGLNGAELIICAEERFGIQFHSDENKLHTCGDFHREIVRILTREGRMCGGTCAIKEQWSDGQVWTEVQKIVSSVLDIPVAKITKEARFVKDLGMD